MSGKERLKEYLAFAGIVCCNINPHLPALSDIGCKWQDMTQLMDEQGLFYCKAYRGRAVYLSIQVYFYIKALSKDIQLNEDCNRLLDVLRVIEPADADSIRKAALMDGRQFNKALHVLLVCRRITALKTGRIINPNWSTFAYCLADTWEKHIKAPEIPADPKSALQSILMRTMREEEYARFAKQNLKSINA